MKLNHKVALITGAGQGIGRELALRLADEGVAIAAIDVHAEKLRALEAELSGKSFATAVADVGDRSRLLSAVKDVEKRLGPIDLLIANAGIGKPTSALFWQAEEIEAQIRVNLNGVINSVEAVLSGMLKRRHGHLVAISSLASYRGLPNLLGYCASKAGVNALFDGLRVELKPHGIAVTTICPGWIRTRLTAHIARHLPYLLEVEDAARQILEAIRLRRAYYLFPIRGAWHLRMLRWLPTSISDWLAAKAIRA